MHDLLLNAGTSRFVLTLVGLGRPIGRPGRGLNLAFGSRSLKHRGPPVPKSNPKPNKYANKSPQLRDAGFLMTLGGADEIAHHYRKHFQHLLEQLIIDESAPNWLEKVGDGNPELQQAMCRAGLTGLTGGTGGLDSSGLMATPIDDHISYTNPCKRFSYIPTLSWILKIFCCRYYG